MQSVFAIVKYIFQKKNIENDDKSISDFFQNGISFPKFVSVVLNIESIPTINKSPQTSEEKANNNAKALNYLYERNSYDDNQKINLSFETEQKQKELLVEILTRFYFKISREEIIEKSNIILQPISKNRLYNTKQIISGYFLLSVLNILTDNEIEKPPYCSNDENLQQIIINNFKKANIPYLLDLDAFKNKEEDIFLIQVQIIFDIFSDRIVQILTNRYLLDMINFIGTKINFPIKFDHFYQIHQNNSFPKYVKNFLLTFKSELTDEIQSLEMKTTASVLNFLKTKDKQFEILYFNFENPLMQVDSTIKFFRALFNRFFIKTTKNEIYEHCSLLMAGKYELKDYDLFHELGDMKYYLELLHFLRNGQFYQENFSFSSVTNEQAESIFSENDVLKIIDQNVLNNFNTMDIVQDLSFYQIQLIFDEIDQKRKILKILIESYNLTKKLKVPNLENLKQTIYSHQQFLKLRKNIKLNLQILNENESEEEDKDNYEEEEEEDKDKIEEKKEKEKQSEEKKKKEEQFEKQKLKQKNIESISILNQKMKDEIDLFQNQMQMKLFLKENEKPETFWNPILDFYKLDNGVLCQKEDSTLEKDIKFSNNNTSSESKNKLYKIFHYDEQESQWIFDSTVFEDIEKNVYKGKNPQVPIVFYLDSNENDLMSINSHFISGSYPDLSKEKQIFVYALHCDLFYQYLTFGFNDQSDEIVNPLFLLLHVPEEKQNIPNIHLIIYQLYAFLSLKSDVNVILFGYNKTKNHFDDQLAFASNLNSFTQSLISNDN